MRADERSFFLHSPVALSLLALFAGFVLLIGFVPLTQGHVLLGLAIAGGAATVTGLAVRMLQDRVTLTSEGLEVGDLWGDRECVFAELEPGDITLRGLTLYLKTKGFKQRKPFEVPAGARYYLPLLEALHGALDADGSGRGTKLLEALRAEMLRMLLGEGVGPSEFVSNPLGAGLAEAANQRLIHTLRGFLEERLGPTPGLRPLKR